MFSDCHGVCTRGGSRYRLHASAQNARVCADERTERAARSRRVAGASRCGRGDGKRQRGAGMHAGAQREALGVQVGPMAMTVEAILENNYFRDSSENAIHSPWQCFCNRRVIQNAMERVRNARARANFA